jgi:uncharacterized membrane protein YgcG
MSNEMIDLAAGDARLRRRLEAYADLRLTPDLTATSRMRARVLAHAHRRADLVRADAALTVVPQTAARPAAQPGIRRRRGTAVALVAAALLVGAMAGGAAASSGPGGALYEARLWIETVSLPSDPSARAVAELGRLSERLREAGSAAQGGDEGAVAAALSAYERIMSEASAAVLDSGDPVAAAALETGLGRNVDVLQALVGRVPPRAADAIGDAVARAIARSAGAIHAIGAVDRPTLDGEPGSQGTTGSGQGGSGSSNAGNGSTGNGSNAGPEATPKPTKAEPERPVATGKPAATEHPDPPPKPTKTPRPNTGQGPPDDQQD